MFVTGGEFCSVNEDGRKFSEGDRGALALRIGGFCPENEDGSEFSKGDRGALASAWVLGVGSKDIFELSLFVGVSSALHWIWWVSLTIVVDCIM